MHLPVLGHIKDLGSDEEGHVVNTDANQDFISDAVQGLVVVAIDLGIAKSVSRSQVGFTAWWLNTPLERELVHSHSSQSHC